MRFNFRSLLLTIAVVALYLRWPMDGIIGNLLSLGCTEDTVWADGYSEDAFRAARVGMSRREVYQILGESIQQTQGSSGQVWEKWTNSPSDGDYRRRELVFQGDNVVKKIAEFWID